MCLLGPDPIDEDAGIVESGEWVPFGELVDRAMDLEMEEVNRCVGCDALEDLDIVGVDPRRSVVPDGVEAGDTTVSTMEGYHDGSLALSVPPCGGRDEWDLAPLPYLMVLDQGGHPLRRASQLTL